MNQILHYISQCYCHSADCFEIIRTDLVLRMFCNDFYRLICLPMTIISWQIFSLPEFTNFQLICLHMPSASVAVLTVDVIFSECFANYLGFNSNFSIVYTVFYWWLACIYLILHISYENETNEHLLRRIVVRNYFKS